MQLLSCIYFFEISLVFTGTWSQRVTPASRYKTKSGLPTDIKQEKYGACHGLFPKHFKAMSFVKVQLKV